MQNEVPSKWLPYVSEFSLLEEAAHWEPLRQWSLSDVWRVTLSSGETVVAKLGYGSTAGELGIYQSVLEPLDILCPRVFAGYKDSECNVFLMEDLGGTTLEMNPTTAHFASAARKLAEIRKMATRRISSGVLKPSVYREHFKPQERFMEDLNFVIEHHTFYSADELKLLKRCLEKLPKHLIHLYERYPVTITHNDYNAKNLLVVNDSIMPIDWSNAHLSSHLGDLYCLIREAQGCDIDKSVVIDAYQELDTDHTLEWQIQVGGICWLIRSLRWLCEEGIQKVPGTHSWIPQLIAEISEHFEQL